MSATPPRKWKFSRRKLLIGLGVTGGALAVGLPLSLPFARLKIAGMLDSASAPAGTMPKDPFVWFEVTPQNRVRLYLPKAEMGQGVHTALAQIAAEELRPAWEQLEVLNASTARGFDMGTMSVGGSVVVSSLYNPLRAAGAALRLMLQEEGARQLGVAPEKLTVAGGVVAATADPSQALTFGQIVSAKQGAWVASKQEPQLREPAQFEFIGKPMPRVDFAAKITGAADHGALSAYGQLAGHSGAGRRAGDEHTAPAQAQPQRFAGHCVLHICTKPARAAHPAQALVAANRQRPAARVSVWPGDAAAPRGCKRTAVHHAHLLARAIRPARLKIKSLSPQLAAPNLSYNCIKAPPAPKQQPPCTRRYRAPDTISAALNNPALIRKQLRTSKRQRH